jgi:hypothetical protein
MPTPSANQGIPEQQGADPANLPNAQVAWDGVMENRLAQRYASIADRSARNPAPNENEISALADVDRIETFDTANWISLHTRSLYFQVRLAADQTINNVGVLTNVTGFVFPVVTTAIYEWRVDMFYDSSTTEDISFAFTWPGGSTARWGGIGMMDVGATSPGVVKNATQAASATAITYGGSGVNTVITGSLFGEIQAGGAGNVQFQFAQAAAAATNTTVRRGTRMQVWRVS